MIRPEYYSDEFSSLYLVAQERKWTPWQFDAMKRLERCEQKGSFKEDIEKTITVIELCKGEYKPSFFAKIRMLIASEPKIVAEQRNWNFFVHNVCYFLECGKYDRAILECQTYKGQQESYNRISEIYKNSNRPLSDLTKEIEVNGEKFVPIEKLVAYDPKDINLLLHDIKYGFISVIFYNMLKSWGFDLDKNESV